MVFMAAGREPVPMLYVILPWSWPAAQHPIAMAAAAIFVARENRRDSATLANNILNDK